MNKSELIREVHDRIDKKVTLKELDQIVDVMLDIMSAKLKEGEEIQLADFGTFALTKFAVKPAEVHVRKKRW